MSFRWSGRYATRPSSFSNKFSELFESAFSLAPLCRRELGFEFQYHVHHLTFCRRCLLSPWNRFFRASTLSLYSASVRGLRPCVFSSLPWRHALTCILRAQVFD